MFSIVGKIGWKEKAMLVSMLVVVGLAIYSNTWHSPFVLDDIHSIVQSEARKKIKWSPTAFLGNRSISYFTLDVNYAIGGLAVEGYHAVNLVLHLAIAGLVTALAYRLGRRSYRQIVWRNEWAAVDNHWLVALIVGLLFLTHPIQTQSVNYIVQRMVLLTTFFYVGALFSYWLSRESTNKKAGYGWAAVSLASSVAAMHTKEIAITLPVAVVMVEYLFFSRGWRPMVKRWWKLLPWLVTMLIIPAYLLEVRGLFIHDTEVPPYAYNENILDKINLTRIDNVSAENQEISRRTYFITQWSVIARYIRLIVWPVGLNIDHDIPWQDNWRSVRASASLLLILGVITGGIWLKWKGRVVGAAGIVLFFLTIAVESSIIPIKDNIFEHRLYLPMAGAMLVVGDALAWWIEKSDRKKWLAGQGWQRTMLAVTAVIVVLGGLTYVRNGVWANALTLWSDAAQKSPHKARPLNNLGLALEEGERREEAEKVYRQALNYNPDNIEVMINVGALLGKTHRTVEAAEILQKAIELKPEVISGYVNLGNVYLVSKEYKKAAETYKQGIALQPENASCWASLGDAYLGQKKNPEAISALEQAVEIEENNAGWLNRLGALYAMAGDYDKAESALNKAIAIDPQLEVARNNLMKLERDKKAEGMKKREE